MHQSLGKTGEDQLVNTEIVASYFVQLNNSGSKSKFLAVKF